MASSIDVTLPRDHQAKFPNKCVVCHLDDPTDETYLLTGMTGWWTILTFWYTGFFSVTAPACYWCGWKLFSSRVLSYLLSIAIVLAACFYVWPAWKPFFPEGLQKWGMALVAILLLMPQIIFEFYFAKPFEVTASKHEIDYEFTSLSYALDFIECNHDAPWIQFNGDDVSPNS